MTRRPNDEERAIDEFRSHAHSFLVDRRGCSHRALALWSHPEIHYPRNGAIMTVAMAGAVELFTHCLNLRDHRCNLPALRDLLDAYCRDQELRGRVNHVVRERRQELGARANLATQESIFDGIDWGNGEKPSAGGQSGELQGHAPSWSMGNTQDRAQPGLHESR